MKPELIVIDTVQGIDDLREYLRDKEYIAYDTETTGLTNRHQVIGFSVCADEAKAFYVILAMWQNAQLVWNPLTTASIELHKELQSKQLIMHNGVFDCMMAEANFKVRLIESLHTDTMVLAHILNENERIGLKEIAKRRYGEDSAKEQAEMKASIIANGGKITKDAYELYKADPYLIGKYGAQDAWLTYKVFTDMVPELYDQRLDKFFYEEETMPLLRGPTYDLNTTGLTVDMPSLIQLKKTLQVEIAQDKDFITTETLEHVKDKYPGTNKKNVFNIGSSQQLSWLLFGKLGLEFGRLTDEGKVVCKALGLRLPYTVSAKRDFINRCEQSKGREYAPAGFSNGKKVRAKKVKDPWNYIAADKDTLAKHAARYEWIGKLLEHNKKLKLLNTYVEGIEERTNYGVIYPSFLQTGTTSGRYSSRNPNWQNLPRKDKRIKACIVARPGKVFVGADYSQLEPRVFSYLSNDEPLKAAFNGSNDFYSVIGQRVYDKYDSTPQKEGSPDAFGIKYPHLRDLSKVIALATVYGATAFQLMKTTGKSQQDTREDMDTYLSEFPGVKKLMLESHKMAKAEGQVKTLFGRPRRIPEAKRITKLYGDLPHEEYPYEVRSLLNLSTNHRVQGTAASIVNRASIRFKELCINTEISAKIVLQVHDSIVAECDEKDSENVSLLLQEAMENTVILEGVPLEALPKIGKNLSEV